MNASEYRTQLEAENKAITDQLDLGGIPQDVRAKLATKLYQNARELADLDAVAKFKQQRETLPNIKIDLGKKVMR